jgi:hypothetical protein
MSNDDLKVFDPEDDEEGGIAVPEGMEAAVTEVIAGEPQLSMIDPSVLITPFSTGMNDAEIQEHLDQASRKGPWIVVVYTSLPGGGVNCWVKRHNEFPVSAYPACLKLLAGQLRDAATRVFDKTISVMQHLVQLTNGE